MSVFCIHKLMSSLPLLHYRYRACDAFSNGSLAHLRYANNPNMMKHPLACLVAVVYGRSCSPFRAFLWEDG